MHKLKKTTILQKGGEKERQEGNPTLPYMQHILGRLLVFLFCHHFIIRYCIILAYFIPALLYISLLEVNF